ncbi:hypothetical protein E2C01_089017 [Portunus trituberculatus]|uniref:Uncharacterized protein n=1 Tax=Portunus trituberculatus TaxID=210409 RepID=A0A5B7JCE5_PORTR|nr:hypothetical protein [Portunus trituberculatus]
MSEWRLIIGRKTFGTEAEDADVTRASRVAVLRVDGWDGMVGKTEGRMEYQMSINCNYRLFRSLSWNRFCTLTEIYYLFLLGTSGLVGCRHAYQAAQQTPRDVRAYVCSFS